MIARPILDISWVQLLHTQELESQVNFHYPKGRNFRGTNFRGRLVRNLQISQN